MDFDFLVGSYRVANRRRHPETGVWEEFPGVNTGTAYLGGQVVVDELRVTLPDGRAAVFVDVHARDPVTGDWSNVIHAAGQPPDWNPMTGRFRDGVGEFVQASNGTHIRHTWDRITGDSARFQQALSADGQNWDTNWIMELTRIRG